MNLKWKSRLNKLYDDLLSKRSWVFFIATIALFTGFITGSEWLPISLVYLGEKVVSSLIINRNGTSQTQPVNTTTAPTVEPQQAPPVTEEPCP